MARTKTTFTLDLGNGDVAKRTSDSMHYTYAVLVEYTDKDKARDVAAAELEMRGAGYDLADVEAVLADPAAVATYAALQAECARLHKIAEEMRVARDLHIEADCAAQRALGYGVPGARNVMVGGTPEADRMLRALGNAEYESFKVADAVRHHPLAGEHHARQRHANATARLARAQARTTGPTTRGAFCWATTYDNAKKKVSAARRQGWTATVKAVRTAR